MSREFDSHRLVKNVVYPFTFRPPTTATQASSQLNVVLNWFEELKRRAPQN